MFEFVDNEGLHRKTCRIATRLPTSNQPEEFTPSAASPGTSHEKAPVAPATPEPLSTRALARQRHQAILSELRVKRAVRVTDLAAALGVSDMTVRRDLDVLEEAGLLDKVHGGATARSERSAEEPGFVVKSLRNTQEKREIASAAAKLIQPGTAIGLAAGTTTWQLAYCLLEIANLIVVTNSIRVADVFHQQERADRTVILTGGIRTPSDALVGSVAAGALRTLHLDQVFMGAHGMSARGGFTSPNMSEAETNRAFIEASDQLVVLADHTKWDITVLSSFATLEDADVIISDPRLPAKAIEALEARSGRLLLADSAP
jgi:DeoR/GlpR family transcriptional regulator of sugar metabolism